MAKIRSKLLRVLAMAILVWWAAAPAAIAACHAFDVQVSPSSVDEGETVTVTVTRDGAVGDSNVRVSTVNGTAVAGSDFTALDQRVNFTGTATERTFRINIIDDGVAEPRETFSVRLSEPGGCEVNPNFNLGGPVTVTINASEGSADPPPPPPSPPAAPPAPAPADPPPPPPPGPAPAPEPEPTESPTEEPLEPADEEDDGGGIPAALVIGVLALVAAAGVAVYLMRQRRTPRV